MTGMESDDTYLDASGNSHPDEEPESGRGYDKIYALVDPRSGEPCYIGKSNDPERRLTEHMKDARKQPETKKGQWLSELDDSGFRPDVEVIAEVPHSDWPSAEREHILSHQGQGWNLVNDLMNKGLDIKGIATDMSARVKNATGESGRRIKDTGAKVGSRISETTGETGERLRDTATTGGRKTRLAGVAALRHTKKVLDDPTARTLMNAGATVLGQHIAVAVVKYVKGRGGK